MDFRRLAILAVPALAALTGFLIWLWSPQKQVRIHTEHFLQAVEQRDWQKAERFVAHDYADRWEHDRPQMLADAREAFAQFFFVGVEHSPIECLRAGSAWQARTRLKLSGSGSPLAQLVIRRVNQLGEPFVFEWTQRSRQPWDWQLTRADQPELEIDRFDR